MARYYIGIDVSKGYSVVSILEGQNLKRVSVFMINDTKKSRNDLLRAIDKLRKKGSLVIGLETTGGYERPLSFFLLDNQTFYGYEFYVVNPYKFSQWRKLKGTKSSDDQVSSRDLALYLSQEYEAEVKNWEVNTRRLKTDWEQRRLVNFIISQLKILAKLKTELKSGLYQVFPGILAKWKEKLPLWIYRVLSQYPTAVSVREASDEELLIIEGVGSLRLKLLRELSNESPFTSNSEFEGVIVKVLAGQILELEQQINKLKLRLVEYVSTTRAEEFEIVKSIRGISDWTASVFLVLLGRWEFYQDKTKLAGFFGIYPTKKVSGDGKAKSRLSKKGNAKMRAILFLMAENVSIYEPYFKELYQKYKSTGKHHYQVIGILMHKLLRVLWGMLKNGELFDAQKDLNNRRKAPKQDQKQIAANELRNLLGEEGIEEHFSAPVSKRHINKVNKILQVKDKDKKEATSSAKLKTKST